MRTAKNAETILLAMSSLWLSLSLKRAAMNLLANLSKAVKSQGKKMKPMKNSRMAAPRLGACDSMLTPSMLPAIVILWLKVFGSR